MTTRYKSICKRGNVAVITGGASGIGLACAREFAKSGMDICLADHDSERLEQAAAEIIPLCDRRKEGVMTFAVDVTQTEQLEALKTAVFERFGQINVLMNNAGIAAMSGSWTQPEAWRKLLEVNMFGVINGLQVFTQAMIDQQQPAMIINTGSKQGITNPPGSPAYNVSKAAVKAITENLQHSLRSTEGCQVSAHLFVPGFVYSDMVKKFLPEKPPFAWTPEQTAIYMVNRLQKEDFYIICPDGEVTEEMDRKRILWGAMDIVENRPALSRWHPECADAFAEHMESNS